MKYRLLQIFPSPPITVKRESDKSSAVTRNVGGKRPPSKTSSRAEKKRQRDEDYGCEMCGDKDEADCLMVCDGCESQYCHTFCIGLTALPKGEWFCSKSLPMQ